MSDRPNAETSTAQHTTHKKYMPPAGFKPTIPASRRPQTHALDRAATDIGKEGCNTRIKFESFLLQQFSEFNGTL